MKGSPSVADKRLPTGVPATRQFGIIDLFALMTMAALLAALVAPLARDLTNEDYVRLIFVGGVQMLSIGIPFAFAIHQRQRVLQRAGLRIGVGFCGQIRWRHWPAMKSSIAMLFLASAQAFIALAFAVQPIEVTAGLSLPYLFYYVQLGAITGYAFARFLWRVYPHSMEFFDNGICLRGTSFVPWQRVEVRRSQYFADRVVVVIRQAAGIASADTKLAQVSSTVKDEAMVAAERGKHDR